MVLYKTVLPRANQPRGILHVRPLATDNSKQASFSQSLEAGVAVPSLPAWDADGCMVGCPIIGYTCISCEVFPAARGQVHSNFTLVPLPEQVTHEHCFTISLQQLTSAPNGQRFAHSENLH